MDRGPVTAIRPPVFEPAPAGAIRRTVRASHLLCQTLLHHVFLVATASARNNPAFGCHCQKRFMNSVDFCNSPSAYIGIPSSVRLTASNKVYIVHRGIEPFHRGGNTTLFANLESSPQNFRSDYRWPGSIDVWQPREILGEPQTHVLGRGSYWFWACRRPPTFRCCTWNSRNGLIISLCYVRAGWRRDCGA